MEQELPTLPVHSDFSGVRVVRSLRLCVMFLYRCLSFWPLCCLSFELQLLITLLVSFGRCVVCPSSYSFLLPFWYLLAVVMSVLRVTASYYPFGIFWPLYCLSFELRLLITLLVSFGRCVVCPSSYGF